MPRRKKTNAPPFQELPPAKTPEERENQLISLAEREAERMMREHTAPSQVICHYLKLGTSREQLEKEKIRQDTELAKAKIKTTESVEKLQNLVAGAMEAFKTYSGSDDLEDYNATN